MEWVAFTIAAGALAFLVINVLMLSTAVYTWFERRTLGRFQNRLGPNRWGPFGILQPIADLVKLITKEDTTPDEADRWVMTFAPLVLVVPTLIVAAVIPFGPDSFLGKLNIGILFVLGVTSVNTIAIFMAGWGSANKYAMLGSMRGVAMLVSYEVPMALGVVGVLILSGSLSLFHIVEMQTIPFLLVQPLGFLIFVAAASAEMSRTPFDQIEAESELGSGYNTEYSGIKFAVLFLAEFMAPIITALVITTLFLGGTRGFDPIPGQVWFVLKTFAVIFALLWVRATWPRLRVDQIMGFAWKGLFPLSLLNIFVVAAQVVILQDDAGGISARSLWIMAAINWVVMIVAIVATAKILGQRRLERPAPTPSPLANMYAEAD
ncbi:MAG: NADH-quinone oxidoreductase subunit NuoH [Dehalococcoidia bacterium]|nr:NADH-quinone oxidoreductase subunit NuoH [Dehalococcoidia bacterium]